MTSNFRNAGESFPYWATFIFCQLALVHDVAMLKFKKGADSAFISTKLFSIGRTVIVGKVALVMKSASDRGRLGGTTFRAISLTLGGALFGGALALSEGGRVGAGVVAATLAVKSVANSDLPGMISGLKKQLG